MLAAGAGFQGAALDSAEALHELLNAAGVVGTAGVAQDLAGAVEDTDLDGVLGVVQADEEWYSGCHVRLLPMGLEDTIAPSYRRLVAGGSNRASSPSERGVWRI